MAKIVAVVATNKGEIGGGAPIFYADGKEELQKIAHLLEKVLDCAAHEVHENMFVIVDRHNNK